MPEVKMSEDDNFVVKGPPPLLPLPDVSIGKLIYDRLQTDPSEKKALVDSITGEYMTYKDLLDKTCSLAASLVKNGYCKDSILAVCSENSLQFYIPVISALYVGAVTATINHNYTEHELEHVLNISKPTFVFCSKVTCHKFIKLKSRLSFIAKLVVLDGGDVDGVESLDSFITHAGAPAYEFRPAEVDVGDQIAFILCSSGTTGLPKGVMVTHRNVMVRFMHDVDPRYFAPEQDQTSIGFLPFFHAYGLITNLSHISRHVKVVVLGKFNERLFLKIIQDYKISELLLVPPIAILLAKSSSVSDFDLSSVKYVSCGAAPLSKDTEEQVKRRLKIGSIRQRYGLTETTLGVIGMPIDQQKHGSCGQVVSYMKCKIRDPESGKSLGPHQTGELCFKGSMVMKGYYGNEKATGETFTSDGWLLTGDLGYYDQDQFFYIVDRLKELIKYKGFQVAPAELESLLLTHPEIRDAGVVGLPREEVGEIPLAFVVKDTNSILTEKEVEDFVAGLVSPQKRLRGGVVFVKAIPKNPSGKILRRELKKMVSSQKLKL